MGSPSIQPFSGNGLTALAALPRLLRAAALMLLIGLLPALVLLIGLLLAAALVLLVGLLAALMLLVRLLATTLLLARARLTRLLIGIVRIGHYSSPRGFQVPREVNARK
jgi:hypothetical protein